MKTTKSPVQQGKPALIEIPALNIRTMELTIVGDSPLVVHRWGEKAKAMITQKQQKKAKQAKEARNPTAEFEEALYRLPNGGGFGWPSIGLKAAAVNACSHIDGMTKVVARGAFHIDGELVKIDSPNPPVMREDMVRIGMGVADIRYRPEFNPWSITFTVKYNTDLVSPEQIANLFNVAGFGVGIGENRPQKNGSWGRFHVATDVDTKAREDAEAATQEVTKPSKSRRKDAVSV